MLYNAFEFLLVFVYTEISQIVCLFLCIVVQLHLHMFVKIFISYYFFLTFFMHIYRCYITNSTFIIQWFRRQNISAIFIHILSLRIFLLYYILFVHLQSYQFLLYIHLCIIKRYIQKSENYPCYISIIFFALNMLVHYIHTYFLYSVIFHFVWFNLTFKIVSQIFYSYDLCFVIL